MVKASEFRLRAAVLGAALSLLGPTAAHAAVRAATVRYHRPADTPSLNPEPPETQQNEYVQATTASYDDQSGTFSVHVQIYDAAMWSDVLPESSIAFAETCGSAVVAAPEIVTDFDYSSSSADDEGGDPYVDTQAVLTRSGYDGQIDGTVTPVADGFTVAFPASPALANIALTCIALSPSDDASWLGEGSWYFDGYEPFELTADNATGWFKRALAERYAGDWTQASTYWALCPHEAFFPAGTDPDRPAAALCMAEFKHDGRWRFVSVRVEQADAGPVLGKQFTRTWTRAFKRVSTTCKRQAHAKGTISSNDGTCPSLMIGDLVYDLRKHQPTRVGWHGTNTAGFTTVARYRCRTRTRTTTCTNGMGDAFRWAR